MHQPHDDRCALILAGGDSMRPDPFGADTLLDQTLQRVACVVPPEWTSVVVTRRHEHLCGGLADKPGRLIVQPEHRGTAPAALYGVLSIRGRNPDASIVIFPPDHYSRNEITFMMRVRSAFRVVERNPGLIVLLGIVPDNPAAEYGWIDPGDRVPGVLETSVLRVQRFWEKPSGNQAETLSARGCLWNSKVVVGSADALLTVLREAAPCLYRAFEPAHRVVGTPEEKSAIGRVYADLFPVDFYSEVLAASTQALTVLPVSEAGWAEAGGRRRAPPLVSAARQ